MNQNEIYKIYGKNYKEMTKILLEASDLIERIPSGARVGIKPNLVSPTPAEYGATTHPEVVAGIIEYLQEHGHDNMIMLESSWIGDKTSEAYEYCGYRDLTERYGVEFLDMQKDSSHVVDCYDPKIDKNSMKLRICDAVDSIDFLINVPVMKGHGQTKITCALKNMKGLIPNTEKRHFHTMGLHKPIAFLSTKIHQDFIVVDHICGDLELEDGGNPIETNCIMTGLDPVLMDAYVCHLLGYEVNEVPYVEMAHSLGCGSVDLKNCRISVWSQDNENSLNLDHVDFVNDENGQDDSSKRRKCKEFSALDHDFFEERRLPSENLLDISYAIEDADSCSACYASLAPAILRLKEEGLYDALLEKLPGKISIGQGFAGKTGSFGVGNCCRNFLVNVPGCPPDEEEVYEALIKYLES